MLLQKIRTDSRGIMISPMLDSDTQLFLHCTGGKMVVPNKNFEKNFGSILRAHGVLSYVIKDRT